MVTLGLISLSCSTNIKNENSKIVIEEGTDTNLLEDMKEKPLGKTKLYPKNKDSIIGYWVGYFERSDNNNWDDKMVYADEGFIWRRENKINISIDSIADTLVFGHSVVAGNYRPFKGIKTSNDSFYLKEPGDHKYDGEFRFEISNGKLKGSWKAYGEIEIKNRVYKLENKNFVYNPDQMLNTNQHYVDWSNKIEHLDSIEYNEGEWDEWLVEEFSTATEKIYQINASNTELKKEDVQNLKKGDLVVIRNTIYARHGYSFKNRPLRVFFDAQPWYIPVHADIRANFTDLEKKNIKLLLRYEKNAEEYYDYFGRG